MKRIDTNIVKYLADTMSLEEKAGFEAEAANSTGLMENLISAQKDLADFQISPEIDERYFSSLLPRVRIRLEKQQYPSFLKKIYYFSSTVTAAIVALLFIFKPASNFDQNYKQLASEVANNISDQEVSRKYFAELENEPFGVPSYEEKEDLNTLLPSELDLNDQTAISILKESVVDEYSGFHNLSDNELEKIASNLSSLNVK
jgi:hypothetical protein